MGSSLIVKNGEFYNFANYFLQVMKQTQFVVYVGFGALILGFLGILTGLIVSITGLYVSKYPKLLHCSVFCLVASAAGNIAAGAVIGNGVKQLDDAIYVSTGTPAEVGSFTQNVTHFQIAMFNGCCASKGSAYSKEIFQGTPDTQDLDGFVKFCGDLKSANRNDINNAQVKLRSCFLDQETYRIYNYTVGNNLPRICQTLEEALVNIVGKKVPGTNTDVVGITGQKPIIPIAAPFASPFFGCGAGYAKAFQAAMLIWAENYLSPMGTTFIACGSIYLVLALLAFVTHYSCSQPRESAEEKYARYLEELNDSSQGAIVKTAQVVDAFEQNNPNRMSMPSAAAGGSNRTSVQNNRLSMQSSASQPFPQATPVQEFAFNVDDKI
jgi:hypothetical protein